MSLKKLHKPWVVLIVYLVIITSILTWYYDQGKIDTSPYRSTLYLLQSVIFPLYFMLFASHLTSTLLDFKQFKVSLIAGVLAGSAAVAVLMIVISMSSDPVAGMAMIGAIILFGLFFMGAMLLTGLFFFLRAHLKK